MDSLAGSRESTWQLSLLPVVARERDFLLTKPKRGQPNDDAVVLYVLTSTVRRVYVVLHYKQTSTEYNSVSFFRQRSTESDKQYYHLRWTPVRKRVLFVLQENFAEFFFLNMNRHVFNGVRTPIWGQISNAFTVVYNDFYFTATVPCTWYQVLFIILPQHSQRIVRAVDCTFYKQNKLHKIEKYVER